MKKILLALMLVAGAVAVAQQKNVLPMPDSGNVSLPLDEYNKLVELAANPPKKPIVPPLNFSLKRADLKLKVEDDHISGTMQLEGETFKKGLMKVPLTTGMTILDARQEGKAVPLEQENGGQVAILAGPAEFSILLNAALPLGIEAGRASFLVTVPLAGSAQITLTVPGEHTSVNLSSGLITNRTSDKGNTVVEATLIPGQSAMFWWATREVATAVVPREVRFLSNVKTLVSVSEADVRLAALADITVVQGEPAQFEVEVPAGYEVTGVTGGSLESSEVQAGTLVLKVSTPSQRSHQFLISLERSITETKESVPFLSFKNTQREIGEVLVEGAGTMELTATEGGSLKRMDVKETNAHLRSLAHFPPQAAFRYHKQTNEAPSLALAWVRFPDSSVLAAVAENAEITTMVTSEGRSLTEVKLTVKNQAQPFLKVALPAGASILTADVNGEKVKPVQGADGNRVPLLRPGFRPTGPYTISFVFMHSGAPFAKKGSSELTLPSMDIPIDVMQWEVYLPEQYKVKDFAGDVIAADRVPSVQVVNGQLAPVGNPISGVRKVAAPAPPGQMLGMVLDPSGAAIPGATVNEPFNLNTNLNVGTVSETVTVDAQSVQQMATNGRNYTELSALKAGVAQPTSSVSANVVNLQRRVAGVLP
jgi:hypothetical protein